MLSPDASEEALRRLFRRQPVTELSDLLRVLETRSRMSVFQRLKVLGYLSSFTHAGRYYTLTEVARFDQWVMRCQRMCGEDSCRKAQRARTQAGATSRQTSLQKTLGSCPGQELVARAGEPCLGCCEGVYKADGVSVGQHPVSDARGDQ